MKEKKRPKYFCEKTFKLLMRHLADYKFNINGKKWSVGKHIRIMMEEQYGFKKPDGKTKPL